MKQRVLVMNGQRLVQSEVGQEWTTTKVGRAGDIPPGFYSICGATPANKSKNYDGLVLHIDEEKVYQQVGKVCVCHSATEFIRLPEIGSLVSIRYSDGLAMSYEVNVKARTKLKR